MAQSIVYGCFLTDFPAPDAVSGVAEFSTVTVLLSVSPFRC